MNITGHDTVIIITFASSHAAIACQDVLSSHHVLFNVLPTPIELSSECGIALEIDRTSLEGIHAILDGVISNYRFHVCTKDTHRLIIKDIKNLLN